MKKITITLATLALVSIANVSAAFKVTNGLNKKACVTLKLATEEMRQAIAPGKTATYEPKAKWLAKVCREISVNTFKEKCPKGVTSMGTVNNIKILRTDFISLQQAVTTNNKQQKNSLIKKAIKNGLPITGKLCGFESFILIQQDSKMYVVTTK